MKISSAFLLTALLCTAWSCKPEDSTPKAPEEPAAAIPTAPAMEPAPPAAPEPTPQPEPSPQPHAPPKKLDVGSEVSLDAVKAATWIQGEAPTSFEPGLVYIFDAWATWCGPCIEVIPHMNDLHKKYYDKGLRVYGMNVFEDGQEKVAAFVKKKGEEMSYPVAYTGKESPFDKEWMQAGGVRGIPHSFVVIDGVIVLKTHPAALKQELIEKLLKGGKEATQVLNEMNMGNTSESTMRDTVMKFRHAMMKGDVTTMETIAAEIEKEDPENMFLPPMKIDIILAKKDWDQVKTALVDSPSTPAEIAAVGMISTRIAFSANKNEGVPPEIVAKASQLFASTIAKHPRSHPMQWVALSRLQFNTGESDAAKQSARSAIEAARKLPQGQNMSPAVLEKFSAEVDAGRLPTMEEFSLWMQEAMQTPPGNPPAAQEK